MQFHDRNQPLADLRPLGWSGEMRWIVMMVLVACSSNVHPKQRTVPPSEGSAADAKTKDGAYEGYAVAHACREPDCVGVTGAGAKWWEGMERERINEDARFRAGFERFRTTALDALTAAGVRSVNGSALGGGCQAFGLVIDLKSWREIDAAIAGVGALLSQRNLREPVTLCVRKNEIQLLEHSN